MKTFVAIAIVSLASGASMWPRASAIVQAAQGGPAVQILPPGKKAAGNPHEKGATYYGLEARATRLTTTFRDGHVAVAERGLIGGIRTTFRDAGGNERAKLTLNRVDDAHDTVYYEPQEGAPFQAVSDPATVHATLDWTARQTYGFAKDGTASLVWDSGMMRPRSAARRDADAEISEMEMTWANGIVAKLSRRTYPRRLLGPGRYVEGKAIVVELTQHGAPSGGGVWFERDQVFGYQPAGQIPGFFVGPEHLKDAYGGWGFNPDPTWVVLQTIAQQQFAAIAATGAGVVAKNCGAPEPNRIAQFFFPTAHANEAGCDNLHWLDGTMLRVCCDDHDRCYEKRGCGSSSWWRFWSSWSCDWCNMEVVTCFLSGIQTYCDMMRVAC